MEILPSGLVSVTNISNISSSPDSGQIPAVGSQKLSFFDHFYVLAPPSKQLLFYRTEAAHLPDVVEKLKSALSLTLHHFYPLTGMLTWSPESSVLEIHYSEDSHGVVFVEAECGADFERLVGEDVHDKDVFADLVPALNFTEFPAPMISLQVTTFAGSGISIGITINHMAVDGQAYWNFVKSWAELCRTGELVERPWLDRSIIKDPCHLSSLYLRTFAPTLPKLIRSGSLASRASDLVRRNFILTSKDIKSLKERLMNHTTKGLVAVSSFVAVCAHAWACTAQARGVKDDETTIFSFLADCRTRLNPPLPQSYFGNAIKPCLVEAKGIELSNQEDGLMFAATAIQKAVRKALEDPLSNCNTWPVWVSKAFGPPSATIVNVYSSPRLQVYGADFGWGRAERVELLPTSRCGIMIFSDARDEGNVQVSMALPPSDMVRFFSLFMDGMEASSNKN
ncbi:malonyl-CoA:anthocyanidin 5-O-glucoside-6''-O-malonyltransferase-like [Magnolia sinica]|uniref:malonyl-CoA:anthocyanidin 5-O-glucoside-6''-O-malonyltransferase-like n=1 Tax=Magnolia sinica TaxID=86752 RepID=UPI0026594457|nr:malonyl-CoA:anthocyanidin 5-O-glucoside-6''-O-malonyltransferase-like [Magnolia sinica]